ncbi:MAG: DNA repair protein RadC [Firmicutes bacterium]|nr:DNA repair protein RadC [Bacillota bacterium]
MSGPVIKALPAEERPRERLAKYGAESLSTIELMAIVLRTGTAHLSVLEVAKLLLAKFESLPNLAAASLQELCTVRGVGKTKAIQLLAAFELGKRLQTTRLTEDQPLSSPQEVAGFLMPRLRFLDQEHFLTLHLNTKNRLLGTETISVGTLDASLVHPREVFKAAIRQSSASLILAHNHPSGDPRPSKEDIKLTHRLKESGELLGIPILDHVIIGDNKYFSMKEEGLI